MPPVAAAPLRAPAALAAALPEGPAVGAVKHARSACISLASATTASKSVPSSSDAMDRSTPDSESWTPGVPATPPPALLPLIRCASTTARMLEMPASKPLKSCGCNGLAAECDCMPAAGTLEGGAAVPGAAAASTAACDGATTTAGTAAAQAAAIVGWRPSVCSVCCISTCC